MADQSRIVLITGGSRGLGRSAALHCARAGMIPVITYQSRADDAAEVVREIEGAGGQAASLTLDTGQIETFAAFVTRLRAQLEQRGGPVSLYGLVHNAGHGLRVPIAEMSEEQFDSLMRVHLKGVFFLTQSLLPLLEEGGRVLTISSGLARYSRPGMAAYAMMKGGIEVFTRYLAQELAPRRIRVNTIAPGAIETDFGGGRNRDDLSAKEMVARATALGRSGLPDDIGALVAAMLSPAFGWVNGQRIEASGGINL